MIEDHVGAEAARIFAGMEEAVDHRQSVAQHVGQRARHQLARRSRMRDIPRCGFRPAFPRPSRHSRTGPCPTCRRRHGASRDRCAAARIVRASLRRHFACARGRVAPCDALLAARRLESGRPRCAPRRRPSSLRRPGGRRSSGCGGNRNGSALRSAAGRASPTGARRLCARSCRANRGRAPPG